MRILFVEDNEDLRTLQSELLEERGYDFVAAGTAEEAEALFNAESFDLLLADVSLPTISGIELARRLRQQRPDLPVVFLSGYDLSQLAEADNRTLALQKPVDDEVLAEHLDRLRRACFPGATDA